MSNDTTVTLAIHTYRRAIELQVRLKAEGGPSLAFACASPSPTWHAPCAS